MTTKSIRGPPFPDIRKLRNGPSRRDLDTASVRDALDPGSKRAGECYSTQPAHNSSSTNRTHSFG